MASEWMSQASGLSSRIGILSLEASLLQNAATLDSKSERLKLVWREARRSVLCAVAVAALLAGCLLLLVCNMPVLQGNDWHTLQENFPPTGISAIKAFRAVLLDYAAAHPVGIVSCYCVLYVTMQTFAIPGTISLSLLSGALYGSLWGLVLVSVVSTVGACTCFGMSQLFGKALVCALWPQQTRRFATEVAKHQGELLNYIIFLRVTPLLPNTFINVASPIVDVPIPQFVLGTLIGCLPNNFMAVSAGQRLSELESLRDLYDVKFIILGFVVGCIALFPVLLRQRSKPKAA